MKQTLIGLLVFFPSPGAEPPPSGVQEVWLTTADGVRLHAFHAQQHAGAPTILWSHGNAGNISQRLPVLQALHGLGVNVLAYDYRGYGASESRRPTEDGVLADALAAYAYLQRQGVPASDVVLFGESLGGAVSVALAAEKPCAGVVLLSTFTRLADVGRVHYGPLAALAGGAFDSVARVQRFTAPLLVMHGTQDELIPFDQGRALAAAAGTRAEFLALEGGTHNDVLGWPQVLRRVAGFARSVAGAAPPG